MSSVTRFIRQIPVSTTYYSAAGVVADAAGVNVYEFVNLGSNYVGNYPPGWMQSQNAGLNAAIAAAAFAGGNALVLRDMGKTIQAPYGVAGVIGSSNYATSNIGFFRQVQLLRPLPINATAPTAAAPGYIGGTTGSNFGVLGAENNPDNYTDYLTFYIPVSVAGVSAASSAVPLSAFAIAGGQM
jgi:hypothetical protein